MKIKLLVLLVGVLISLPGVSTAEQSSEYPRQLALSEQNAARIKAQSEQNAARIKVQSEQNAARIKAQSEQNAARIKAQSEQNAARIKAQSEQNAARIKAQSERNAANIQAQLERNAASQMAASAVNADNGIVNKIYSFLKTGLLENIYKLFQGGPSTPAQYPSGSGTVTDMGITIIENSPEIAQNQKNVTDAQKRWIPEAVELCRDGLPMEEILMSAPGVQGGELFFPKQRLTSVIKNEAIKQGIICKE